MKKADVLAHFGSVIKTAAAFHVTRAAVYQWPEIVPERIAYRAERLTGGALRVDPSLYPPKRGNAA